MKIQISILIAALLLFCNCINKETERKPVEGEVRTSQSEENVELNTQISAVNNIENEAYHDKIFQEAVSNLSFDNKDCLQDFDMFFEMFSTDSVFQKKWTLFPLKESYLGGDFYEDLIIEYIDSSSYEFKDFSKDKYAMDKEFDKYFAKFDFKEREVRYQWRGYDNGIFIDFIFFKINNCWFLIAIEDRGT